MLFKKLFLLSGTVLCTIIPNIASADVSSECHPEHWDENEFSSEIKQFVLYPEFMMGQSEPAFQSRLKSGMLNGNARISEIKILSWYSMVNDRSPMKSDEVFTWVKLEEKNQIYRYAIVLMYRHPDQGPKWSPSYIFDAETGTPIHYFDHAPKNTDVYSFDESRPDGSFWKLDSGFHYTAAAVCKEIWENVIGKNPPVFLSETLPFNHKSQAG